MTAVFFPLGKHLKNIVWEVCLFRHFQQIYCHWNIYIQTQQAFIQAYQRHCYFFLPQDPYFNNFKFGWFGHFHTYFNQLLIHTTSSCQDRAADTSGNICPLTRESKLFCSFVWFSIYPCSFLKFPLPSQKMFRFVSQSFTHISGCFKYWGNFYLSVEKQSLC